MAALAALIGVAANMGGLALSLWQDTPAGPSIIVVASVAFALAAMFGRAHRARG